MKALKTTLLAVGVIVLAGVGYAAYTLRPQAEEIPETLPELDTATLDPMAIKIPDETLPPLALADLKGNTVTIVLDNKDSWKSKENRPHYRALNRWVLPETSKVFAIADLNGLGLFRGKISEIMAFMRPEMRHPLYLDFEGVVYETLKMPKGALASSCSAPTARCSCATAARPTTRRSSSSAVTSTPRSRRIHRSLRSRSPTSRPRPARARSACSRS